MKIIDILKNEEYLKENDIMVEDAVLHKASEKLDITFVLDKALNLKNYNNLTKKIKEAFSDLKVSLSLVISYKDESLTEEELKEYLSAILLKLEETSPRFKALSINDGDVILEDSKVTFLVAFDAKGLDDLCDPIVKEFENYGFLIDVRIKEDESKSVAQQIQNLDNKMNEKIEAQRMEALQVQKFNEDSRNAKKSYYKYKPEVKTQICDLPRNYDEIQRMLNETGEQVVLIEGYVFQKEIKEFPKSKNKMVMLAVTDETDSILVKKWLRGEEEIKLYSGIENGTIFQITGKIEDDSYEHQVLIMAQEIVQVGVHKEEIAQDNAVEKRVELHAHSKMSTLDSVVDASTYVKTAIKWGWKSLAITDHSGVYSIPDVLHSLPKECDFKPLYGVELNYINDQEYFITFDDLDEESRNIDLKSATYIVYDIETTGLSQTFDSLIEIAAYKVYQGGVIEKFEKFINPGRHIPESITELTSITDDMVKDAKNEETILKEFMEFCKGCVFVAHNAKFDVGMIYAKSKKYNIDFPLLGTIDSLNLFRVLAGYQENRPKRFNLEVLAKTYKVKEEKHHRANDDTRVLALSFVQMLQQLYQAGVYNYKDINSLIKPELHYELVFPYSLNILAKTQAGFKNMYKLLSDAMTKHLYGDARLLKSVLDEFRDGILVGSGDNRGEVFEYALNRSEEECKKAMEICDYIEVQPPMSYAQYFSQLPNGKEDIELVIKNIIKWGKEMGKIVVATSDCHYLRPKDKKYRDILIAAPQIGGGVHPLARKEVKQVPDQFLRTTEEMLDDFKFLGDDLAYEIVVTNTNLVADQIEAIKPFSKEMFSPRDDQFKDSMLHIPSIADEMTRIVYDTLQKMYGDNPHPIIKARVERELKSIISFGNASVYYVCHLLVKKSNEDGYLVGSRGSVGSSIVATLMNITEVNPLAPHYVCKKCHFHTLRMSDDEIDKYGLLDIEKPFQTTLRSVSSGFDLPDQVCPVCGNKLSKDGHDIPFETFLGFNGEKVPDIDLNFSGEYQATAHAYIRDVFGYEYAFRGGTVGTVAEKNAFGYVKGYCERTGQNLRDCEITRLSQYIIGVKRSTGQHPGGIVVVPNYVDIYDVTPVQYPADNKDNAFRTTHYDYHSFEDNLLKFDILGHDNPTIFHYIMEYVHAHQDEFPFSDARDIPIDDKREYALFGSTESIGLTEEQLGSKVASFGLPEFGTQFVRGMLVETLPKSFAEVVKISGLSHGTNVWANNSQELVNGRTEFGKIEFADTIGCRDDIMIDLIRMGLEPGKAFNIMEFVRKNKKVKSPDKWEEFQAYMREKKVPEWYIWSCDKIEYMFPKAHAIAYVLDALRFSWFKLYYPPLFYSAWLSKRAKAHDVFIYMQGVEAIRGKIRELTQIPKKVAKEEDLITSLQIVLEMKLRGYEFLPVDINKSDALNFTIEDGKLRIPFVAVDKLGETVALDIVNKRNEEPFDSIQDVEKRTKLSSSLVEEFKLLGAFGDLKEESEPEAEGLFAFGV